MTTLHALIIELPELSAGDGKIVFTRDEQLAWLKDAARRGASLVVLPSERSLELYSTERDRKRAFRAVLESLQARVKAVPAFAKVRTVEKIGLGAARHLLRRAGDGGLAGSPRLMTQLHAATALSAYSSALGADLGSLFRAAVTVSRRIRKETELADPNAPRALREVEQLAADRIVEEEMAAWQAQEAEVARVVEEVGFDEPRTLAGVSRLPAPERRKSSMLRYGPAQAFVEEPGSMIRVRIETALASSDE